MMNVWSGLIKKAVQDQARVHVTDCDGQEYTGRAFCYTGGTLETFCMRCNADAICFGLHQINKFEILPTA